MPCSRLSDSVVGGIVASIALVLIAAVLSFVYVYRLRLRKPHSGRLEGVYEVAKSEDSDKVVEAIPGARLAEGN